MCIYCSEGTCSIMVTAASLAREAKVGLKAQGLLLLRAFCSKVHLVQIVK